MARKQRIIVRLKGGLAIVQPSTIPEGVEVEVRDFDILELEGGTRKEDGKPYMPRVFARAGD
jgi:hypothetical protein